MVFLVIAICLFCLYQPLLLKNFINLQFSYQDSLSVIFKWYNPTQFLSFIPSIQIRAIFEDPIDVSIVLINENIRPQALYLEGEKAIQTPIYTVNLTILSISLTSYN